MSQKSHINALKTKKNAIILAHNYQLPEIQDVADIVGDSLELAMAAKETDADIIVFCGVRFMAETAKILNPSKKVLLPVKEAGCPLADQLTPGMLEEARSAHPEAMVVLYINSTAECKAYADVICTSANAVKVVRSLSATEIIVGPDSNLAAYIQDQVPEKKIIPIPPTGHCHVHDTFSSEDIRAARLRGGKIICHPECRPEIQKQSDIIASTGGMIRNAPIADLWNVFTEREMGYRLKKLYPDKTFHIKESAVCDDMKMISIPELEASLQDEIYEVLLPDEIMSRALGAIERMIAIGR